ncbi:hypothetical protein J18TS1_12170 [Oceanobacillus oncorhynchi subsp. incaldanensis]|uniref:helix-turn-helix domain-containing protein n=1 Tax=Oceanobacillus oncorhynchi TaxID=545501 RepID=UPI001B170300|nr:helix-turn-helix transcriptional regulator [Oceanobacillus oncorhynchi]GIO18117.1 hypothetical protein J18TS1_12170 [Oceanobacillus oncorhynchi subsp. incaldanensis]
MVKFCLKDSDNLRVLIASTGNSIKSFSKRVGISYPYMSRIVTGKNNPSATVANKIAKALNVEITDLFLIENKR